MSEGERKILDRLLVASIAAGALLFASMIVRIISVEPTPRGASAAHSLAAASLVPAPAVEAGRSTLAERRR